ncbi:MAG: hypothetical protein ABL999_14180 [Pyrinomonadaceae bacterium]
MKRNQAAAPHLLVSAIVFAIYLLSAFNMRGQNVRNTDYGPDQALKSNARVNPSTLAMELSIPLGGYSGRGGNGIPLGVSYSSKLWEMAVHGQWQSGTGENRTGVKPVFAKRSAGGWSSSLGTPRIDYELQKYRGNNQEVTYEGEGYEPAPWYPKPSEDLFTIKRLRVTMPDGATHEFRASDAPLLCGNMNTTICSLDQTGVYLSVDGSRMRLEVGPSSSILYLPDGGRYLFAPGTNPGNPAHTFYDRHGNKMTFNTGSFTWTDTMGRSIPDLLPYNWNGTQNQTVGDDQIKSYPGLSGNYNLKFSWHYLLDPNGEGVCVKSCGIRFLRSLLSTVFKAGF